MTRKVRIVRKTVSFRQSVWRFNNLLRVLLNVFYVKPLQEQERMRLDLLRSEKIRKDLEVAEMRRQKLANELVIQDLKIEALNKQAGHPVPPEWTYDDFQHPKS